jgi:hypothetical protein
MLCLFCCAVTRYKRAETIFLHSEVLQEQRKENKGAHDLFGQEIITEQSCL